MVEIKQRRLLIDGKPRLLLAGEVHYYRLQKREWEDRILKAKAAGCDTIATYIPWIVHEEREGQIDLTGTQRPENAIGDFIDLCHRHQLFFIARPGPFVMAEMKNEGIPYWVYERFPEAAALTWEGAAPTTKTLDYLDPGFLGAADRWYGGIMPLLASRLQPKGGPIIGVQLDNEIGMLSWVSNQPDLNEGTLCRFAEWLTVRHSDEALKTRYGVDMNDPAARMRALRNPAPEIQAAMHADYGRYERARIAQYVAILRGYAERRGVTGVPFIVNIHGTGGGKGHTFPIGIHQLMESYTQEAGYLSGSDHYFGELTRDNAPDFVYMNAFMDAVHRPEQPLTSLEFEAGSGDYGETGASRQSGASVDFKIRLAVAQGNRLLNYYLIAGGRNPMLLDPVFDGNDRVAFTGERHGFAAPINPEGELTPNYRALTRTNTAINAVADKLADMDPEYDGVSIAFVPDYYNTAFHRPGPMREVVQALEWPRSNLDVMVRGMLFEGFRFTAVDVQNRPITTPALALASATLLDAATQTKLVDYVRGGGRLLLFGAFPVQDLELRPCTILADALGWQPATSLEASGDYHLSLVGESWSAFEPETRVWRAQTFAEPAKGEVIFRTAVSGLPVGLCTTLGGGRVVSLPANYPLHRKWFSAAFDWLGVAPGLRLEAPDDGVLAMTMGNASGERFLTLVNLDHDDKPIRLTEQGRKWVPEGFTLPARGSRLMPLGVRFGSNRIDASTAELEAITAEAFVFRQTPFDESATIDGRQVRIPAGRGTVSVPR